MHIDFFKERGMIDQKIEYIERCFSVEKPILELMKSMDITTVPYEEDGQLFIGCHHFLGFKCQLISHHLTIYEIITLLRDDLNRMNILVGGYMSLEELCLLYPHRRKILGTRGLYLL